MKFSLHLFLMVLLVVFGFSLLQAQDVKQTWGFSESLGDWASGAQGASIALSKEQALSDSQSVKMVKATGTDVNEINLQNDVYDAVVMGDVISVNVYISANHLAVLNGVQLFWHDNGWGWHAKWTSASSLTADAWNKVSATVDAGSLPVQRIGVQATFLATGDDSAAVVYFDDFQHEQAYNNK